ncbi:M23 family metallopeptidase [Nocardioides sp.]|uniref:M23 family metallopeptidase n=1 Tax=Nocardioides sp. TaxID=35761 RepID=UPI002CFE8C50|nr:M23 family metallopeptidase [Nocardioides sp.]HSX67532.1 M23 family metallopeptidase [Nocardioides sp.]
MYLLIPALLTALSSLPAPVSVAPPGTLRPPVAHRGSEPVVRVDPAGIGVWPVGTADGPPAVVHGFAPPPAPYAAGHRGVDLAAVAGTPVKAALAGQVLFAGTIAGKGVVVVGHGETRTTYEPVTPLVRVGDRVERGGPIGVLRPGGHCTPGTCLHWGWLRGDTYLDPLELVGAFGPVRLKPWTGLPAAS